MAETGLIKQTIYKNTFIDFLKVASQIKSDVFSGT